MIFDDTSILDGLSDKEDLNKELSYISNDFNSIKLSRNHNTRNKYFEKYQHLYSKNTLNNNELFYDKISISKPLYLYSTSFILHIILILNFNKIKKIRAKNH